MEQLHDIEGLDLISVWPLAIGWWVVMAIVFLCIIAIAFYTCRRAAFKRSWKHDALMQLDQLENDLSEERIIDTTTTLSGYLRCIAISCRSREECAGLAGRAWLQWLAKHDPKRFDWENRGKSLIEAPYAPPNMMMTAAEIKDLIQAARRWVT